MSWAGPFQYDIGKSREPRLPPGEFAFDQQRPTLLVLSHLRWSFVYQRPQHLMSRFAREFNVLFFEEPIPSEDGQPRLGSVPLRLAGSHRYLAPGLRRAFRPLRRSGGAAGQG